MSETKFTQATWSWSEIDPDDKEWGACEVFRDELDPEFVATHVCGKANAALIAAAPDLYQVALLMIEYIELDREGKPRDPGRMLGEIHVALKKARGEL